MDNLKKILSSWRFWSVVLISLIEGLKSQGVIVDGSTLASLASTIELIVGGATAVRTIDRHGEKKVK